MPVRFDLPSNYDSSGGVVQRDLCATVQVDNGVSWVLLDAVNVDGGCTQAAQELIGGHHKKVLSKEG